MSALPGFLPFSPQQSRAILIGSSHRRQDEAGRDSLWPAVNNNVWDLGAVLRDERVVGIEDVHMIVDRPHHEIVESLYELADPADKLSYLLIYFAGHGMLGDGAEKDALYLVTRNTRDFRRDNSSLPYLQLAKIARHAKPDYLIIVLDCCFSGKAFSESGLATPTCLVTACTEDRQAWWPREGNGENCRHTALTAALIHVLRSGLGDPLKSSITLEDLESETVRLMKQRKWPVPSFQRTVVPLHTVRLARNISYSKTALEPELRETLKELNLLDDVIRVSEQTRIKSAVEILDDHVFERVKQLEPGLVQDPQIIAMCQHKQFRSLHQSDKPGLQVDREVLSLFLESTNGDVTVTVQTKFQSAKTVRSTYRFMFGDTEVNNIGTLRLRVETPRDETPRNHWLVPITDKLKSKEVVDYIDPPLSQQGEIAAHWSWPRMFGPLFSAPSFTDQWVYNIRNEVQHCEAITRVILPPDLGEQGELEIDERGESEGRLTQNGAKDDTGNTVYEWTIPRLQSHQPVELQMRWKPRGAG